MAKSESESSSSSESDSSSVSSSQSQSSAKESHDEKNVVEKKKVKYKNENGLKNSREEMDESGKKLYTNNKKKARSKKKESSSESSSSSSSSSSDSSDGEISTTDSSSSDSEEENKQKKVKEYRNKFYGSSPQKSPKAEKNDSSERNINEIHKADSKETLNADYTKQALLERVEKLKASTVLVKNNEIEDGELPREYGAEKDISVQHDREKVKSASDSKSHLRSKSDDHVHEKARTSPNNNCERSPRMRSKEEQLRKRPKSKSGTRSRSNSLSVEKQCSELFRERRRSHSEQNSARSDMSNSRKSHSKSRSLSRSKSHDNLHTRIKTPPNNKCERSPRRCSKEEQRRKRSKSKSLTRSSSRSLSEEKQRSERHRERRHSHSADNYAEYNSSKTGKPSSRKSHSKSTSLRRSKSYDNLQGRMKTPPKNKDERSQLRKRFKSRSFSRSHSRSRSKEKQSSEKRSERKRSHSADFEKRKTRRSESLEKRREERKKRHAERDEREKAKRAKKDEENVERREKELNKPDGDPDKVNELDNTTVTDPKAKITERQRKTVDLLTSRTGGAYIPPAKLRLMQAEITDKSSAAYQRIAWEALKKSIHGYINKVNVDNIAIITRELLKENIVRGRGLLCRSIIQAQAASPTFTHVYAALVSIVNSKFPNIGELLLKRLVIQFKRAFRRNDKPVCLSSSRFIAHLVNQRVAHEILALEILTLLVESPTDDSVEVAIAFLKECGMKLTEVSSKGIGAIFEMLKNILHEGKLDKRVQYMIEVVFQVRKDGFKDHQSVIESLELVEEDDQFTHLLMLDDATNTEDVLNAFKFDEEYAVNEEKYKGLSREILGSDASDSNGSSSVSGSGSDSDSADSDDNEKGDGKPTNEEIIDNTETNLIALRRTIYLTINSSLDYEECAHKLMKMQLKPGQEIELCHMFLDCCAEQRTYEKFYGLLAQRFCSINKIYIEPFEEIFKDTYQTTHRLDTNRLRNVSKFFAHLLFTDAISWDVLECIKLNEDDTTSSSRIFIKILFQELAEYMGLAQLNKKLKDEVLVESLAGLFPKDNPRNTRFSINFFTSIGLGGLTDELRQFLKNAPKSVPAINAEILANKPIKAESSSSSTSTSSPSNSSSESSTTSSESSSDSDSVSEKNKKKRKRKKSKKTKKSSSTKRNSKKLKKKKSKSKKTHKKRKKSKKHESSSSESDSKSETQSSSSHESSENSSDSSSENVKSKSKKNSKRKAKQKRKSKEKSKHDETYSEEKELFEPALTNEKRRPQSENGFESKRSEVELEKRNNRRGNNSYKNERSQREEPQRRDSEVERRREERAKRHRAKEQEREKDEGRSRSRSQTRHHYKRDRSRSQTRHHDYRDRKNRNSEYERDTNCRRQRKRHEESKSRSRSRSRKRNNYEK